MPWYPVAKVGDVRSGDVRAVDVAGVEMVLARDGDAFYALQRQCLHQGGDLSFGILSRGHVICPMHGWRFDAATGRNDRAAEVCLVRYATRVVGDDVEIDPTPITGSS